MKLILENWQKWLTKAPGTKPKEEADFERILKKNWNDKVNADPRNRKYIKSFKLVHWFTSGDPTAFLETSRKDEISAEGYAPLEPMVSRFAKRTQVGVLLEGYVTFAMNKGGGTGFYGGAEVPEEWRSSGMVKRARKEKANRRPNLIIEPGDAKRSGDWFNEFIVDNWKPVALVASGKIGELFYKELYEYSQKSGLPIVNQMGNPLELPDPRAAGWREKFSTGTQRLALGHMPEAQNYHENWRQYLNESVEETLDEGITDVVFHKTRLDLAADILDSNKFMTSVAFGTPADKEHNKGKLYYFSTMRSPTGDYSPSLPAVTFGLDGRKLGERSKAAAVDYWGPNFPTDEMEDRVLTDEPYLSPATKYITGIHVGLPISDKYRKMRATRVEEAEAIDAAAERLGIPVYFYTSEKTYSILNKTKRLTLDQWKEAFKEAGSELDEPWGYESRPYKSSLLADVAQMIQGFESGNVDNIEKGYQTEWYNIKYDSQWGKGLSGRASQLQVAIHNAKANPDERDVVNLIAQKVKKLGGLQELTNWIQQEIKKWSDEQELKQVAERRKI